MGLLKCKMCGGDLNTAEGQTIAECEYCGTRQTTANCDNEKKINLFNRANRLRINSDYTKDGEATCWWWLRSPGRNSSSAASVNSDGGGRAGHLVNFDDVCVRPALWIEI